MKATWITTEDSESQFYKTMAAEYDVVLEGKEELLIVSDDEARAAGYAAFTLNESFLDIMFFIVTEECRGQGYGAYMLKELCRAAKLYNAGYIRYMMPASSELTGFFEREGFDIFPGKRFYEISIGSLYYSKTFRGSIFHKESKGAKSIADCDSEEQELIRNYFEQNGIDREIPYNIKLSNVRIRNGVIESLVLFDTLPNGQITISHMYVEAGHAAYLLDNFRKCSSVLEAGGRKVRKLKLLFSIETGNELELIKQFIGNVGLIHEVFLVMTAVKRV